ncbi:MAG: polA, partial [Acidimicrobiaceae bacterium]|nr:polA [Acidimicrobiaceae bacterium]
AKLVTTYGDLDTIFARLSELTPKLRENLAAHEAQVRLNALLTPVACDVPIEVTTDELMMGREDREALASLLGFLEMRVPSERLIGVLDRLGASRRASAEAPEGLPPVPETVALPVRPLEDAAALLEVVEASEKAPEAFVVVEPAWSGAPGRSDLVGLAILGEGADEVAFLPGALLSDPEALATLGRLLSERPGPEGPIRPIVGHRTKELYRVLLPLGLDGTGLRLDTAVGAYLVDPAEGQASLELLAQRAGLSLPGSGAVSQASVEQLGFALEEAPESGGPAEQAGARAEVIGALARRLSGELEAVGATSLLEDVERPLVRVLARMEVAGVLVDRARLSAINTALTTEARRLEEEIQELAGGPFNVNSTLQLREVLYDRLGLKPQRKTKTGYSTDAATLEKLRDEHPVVEALLRYREVEKLRSTYGEGLTAEVAADGRIHASFNQTVARTGRLSSDQPNLHNIPVRTEEGRRFREAFVAPPGAELVVADYNQIELRVIAHLSDDPGLVAAFAEGRDIHTTTASGVFGVEASEVTSTMRARAKMVSYGLAYGMEAYGLSRRLAIPVEEAAAILERYFEAFPAVRQYMDDTVVQARQRGYTETALGRRRYLPELASDNFRIRQAAERQAMNAGIQGLAADIFKVALVRLDAELERRRLASRIVLQVHDELLVEAPASELDEVEALTLETMRGAYPLSVPLEVNLARGTTWASAKHG